MKRIGFGLAIMIAATTGAVDSSTEAKAADGRMFSFSVCNRSAKTASVAIGSHYSPGSKDYVVAGWWQVAAGACRTIGNYPRGHFYTHAKAAGLSWGRGDIRFCTETPGPFKRINLGGSKCAPALLRKFSHVDVQNATYTLTLNP